MKRILLIWALLGLVAGCTGHREIGRYDGPESDIRPVIQLGHSGVVQAVAISPDDRFAVSGSADGEIRLWQTATGKTIRKFAVKFRASQITALDLSPDGRMILAGDSEGIIRLIDPAAENPIQLLGHHSSRVSAVTFSPDGRLAVAGSWDGSIKLWGMHPRREFKSLKGHNGKVVAVKFNLSSDRILSCASDGTIKLWDTASNLLKATQINHQADVYAAAFSVDERFIITGGRDRTLKRSWITTGRTINSFEGRSSRIHSVIFSPDGNLLLSSLRRQVNCWDMATGRLRQIFKATLFDEGSHPRTGYLKSAGFSPDGRRVVSLETDGTYHTWDLASGKEVKTIAGKQYPLQVTAPGTEKIETLRVFLNGKPIREITVTLDQAEFNLSVPLVFGVNRITAVAYDARGFSSNPKFIDVVSKNPELQRPNLHVFAVGVSRYARMQAQWQLEFAHTDARAIIDAFKNQEGKMFGSVSSTLLVNEEATADAILENLCASEKNDEVDIFVVFLAGHGVKTSDGDYYFLGHKGTFDDPQSDGLNWRRLKECLSRAKGRATLFLDACHSGSIVNETVVPNDEMAHQFFTGERAGIMVFTASKGRQSALESPDIGGGFGVFTWALTQGIGAKAVEADINGNQVVEFMELVNFVERTVSELTNGAQTPWLSRKELFGDLPIATVE